MRLNLVRIVLFLSLLGFALQTPIIQNNASSNASVTKSPAEIRQGPWRDLGSSPGDPYWYQTGALGGAASYNYVAASVQIKTAYDQVNNDAHSYWVGGFIANNAFVQVGFLNEITTTGQPYCCAWFFEYFLPSSSFASGCCGPIIGREGSAGPVGSWHNYTISSNGDGVWSFYFDGTLLGHSADLGGMSAANSGSNGPGAIAEVASASSNADVIGPGEFKNLSFRVSGGNWQRVPQAKSLIWYGKGSFDNGSPPPNPYGAREVEGVDNDFLAGSFIPPLNNPTPPQNPSPDLWPTAAIPCCITFQFLDPENASLQPSWISFQSSTSTPIFYTQYENQPIEDGTWRVSNVMWHSINVALPAGQFTTPGTSGQTFHTNVFYIRLRVVGIVSGLPVGGALITTAFPDGVTEIGTTDELGTTTLTQLPQALYALRLKIPFGIPAMVAINVTGSVQANARVLAFVEVLLITGAPIGTALSVLVVAVRKEQRRKAAMPTIPPSIAVTGNCSSCGHPLQAGRTYCTNCGTIVKTGSF